MAGEDKKIRGKAEQGAGKLKEEVGKLGGDSSTEWGGKLDQLRGKAREGVGDVEGAVHHPDPKDADRTL